MTDTPIDASPDSDGPAPRPAWLIPAVVAGLIAVVVAIVLVASNGDDESADDETTTTTEGEDTTTTEGGEVPEVELTIGEADPVVFVVERCDTPTESTITLEAESKEDDDDAETIDLEVKAEDGDGTITLSGREEAEGVVDSVVVGDTGEITVTGQLTPSDDSAEPSDFELTGSCV